MAVIVMNVNSSEMIVSFLPFLISAINKSVVIVSFIFSRPFASNDILVCLASVIIIQLWSGKFKGTTSLPDEAAFQYLRLFPKRNIYILR